MEIAKSSTKSKIQLLYIEFEEAAIEAYNESLLSILNFKTKLNFYRLTLELCNFKFFSPIFSLIHKSLQFKRENAPGESQGGIQLFQ